jgi:DNA polymerase-3 subunit epsilon
MNGTPPLFERNLAITDVETTGFDFERHEILEIGLLIVHQSDLTVLREFEVKVRPEHLGTADPESLMIAGYSDEGWKDAVPILEAMRKYGEHTQGAIFCAHPTTMDWGFIERAFKKTDVQNGMHYHQLDLFSMAWMLFKEDERIGKVTLMELARHFDIEPEPSPHRAINGARMAHEILRKLVESASRA